MHHEQQLETLTAVHILPFVPRNSPNPSVERRADAPISTKQTLNVDLARPYNSHWRRMQIMRPFATHHLNFRCQRTTHYKSALTKVAACLRKLALFKILLQFKMSHILAKQQSTQLFRKRMQIKVSFRIPMCGPLHYNRHVLHSFRFRIRLSVAFSMMERIQTFATQWV